MPEWWATKHSKKTGKTTERDQITDFLGTVLKHQDDYLICVTPACDAERPDKIDHIYCFLRAEKIILEEKKDKKIENYIVIKHDEKAIPLEVKLKPYLSLYIPDSSICAGYDIIAAFGASVKSPIKSGYDIKLKPVAQLRSDHALSLSDSASSEATRVGVDRVEFIRTFLRRDSSF